jgi:hypothetical protein
MNFSGAKILRIQDSGEGFNTVAAAQRYTQRLRGSTKQGSR